MRSFKLISLFLAVSLIGFASQLTWAQVGPPERTDVLASIACNAEVVGLKLTGKPIDPALAGLRAQKEARIAANNVLNDRLLKFMALPEFRPLRATLEDLPAKGLLPECRSSVELALENSYTNDPLIGAVHGIAGWRGGVVRLATPGATHVVTAPTDPVGVGLVFLWCLALPPPAGGPGAGTVDVNGVRAMTCPPARLAGAAVKAGQKLTFTATAANTCFVWTFAEGGRTASGFGNEIFPPLICPPPPVAAATPLLRIPSSPGPPGLGALIAAAKTFEHRKALTLALSEIVRTALHGQALDTLQKQLEECVALGKDIPVAGTRIICDAAGRAAIAEEDLGGFYVIHGGHKLVFGKPDPDKPFLQDAIEVCQAILDVAVGKHLVGGKTNSELRWAAALAFMAPSIAATGALGGVRLKREGIFEFVALCPELLRAKEEDKDKFLLRSPKDIRTLKDNFRKFLDVGIRTEFAIGGGSEELRKVAAASVAGAFADLQVDIIKVVTHNGLVDQKALVALLGRLKFTCEINPDRADLCIRERVLGELAIAASSRDARQATGLGMGLLWEEWTRLKDKRSSIIDIFKRPLVEARDGCGRAPYGAFCFALANNAPGSTLNWPEYAAAAIPVLARHFAGRGTVLNFFRVPKDGFQVTLAFDWGQLPCDAPNCP